MAQRVAMAVILGLGLGLGLGVAGPAPADPAPYPEFTFKRVTPPKPGAQRRITVQIVPPEPQVVPPEPPAAKAETAPAPGPGWFWAEISPALADSGPGRLAPAVAALNKAPEGAGIPVPRLQLLQDIATAHGVDILLATAGTRVSPALALAVIGVESGGRADARSSKGAAGLMQLMPDTATRFGVEDTADAAQNIKGGVAYLDWLMGKYGGDPVLVLAAYNAGEGSVRDHEGVPPFAETRNYVPRVLAAWTVARGLCQTPPQLISDGCVFRVMGAG